MSNAIPAANKIQAYSPPKLTTYGSVLKLTAGGSDPVVESNCVQGSPAARNRC